MAIKRPIYLNRKQLNKVINGNFPASVKQQAQDMLDQINQEEKSVKTWNELKDMMEKYKRSKIDEDQLISILQTSGWVEPII